MVLPDEVPTMVAADSLRAPIIPVRADNFGVPDVPKQPEAETFVERHDTLFVATDTASWLWTLQHRLDSLSRTSLFETTQLGLSVYDLTDHRELFAVNPQQRMRPASCQKLVTAITGLHLLGGDYKLCTELRIEGIVSDSVLVGNVYVVGGMDPMLSRDEVRQMVQALRQEGIDSIAGAIYADLSMKDDKELGWGWCWDDKWGPLSALTVDGKNTFSADMLADLRALGIRLSDSAIYNGQAPANSRTLCVASHSLDLLLDPMMKNSDNIFAESLFYQIAAHGGKKQAGRKQAVPHMETLIKGLGLDPARYQIADGSGLSLYNYVTPQLLVRLLAYAWDSQIIRRHLYPTLPIAGVDGTLQKRMRKTPAEGNVRAKTGTVEGISSLAGYATAPNGHTLCFAIINQGIIHTSDGKDFQDKVCRLLCGDERI